MVTISELIREIEKLPKGNIYKKKINGKTYYYHQYFLDGKRYSIKIKENELEELRNDIDYRKMLEEQVKILKSEDEFNVTISNNLKEYTGSVMSGDIVVATYEKGELTYINENLSPLIIKKTKSLEAFLKLRIIDEDRVNSRLLKKLLNIHEEKTSDISLYNYSLSISDNYWFKPKHSKLKYEQIKLNNDNYFDVALKGDTTYFVNKHKLSPELTTVGSFEKGWKKIFNTWWLYKKGSNDEIFSELFCSRFASLIGLKTVIYEYDDGYIRSKNFADKDNFEPMASLAGDDDRYEIVFEILKNEYPELLTQYLKLVAFDVIVNNVDRHNENYGFMRDRKTGIIKSISPNFDNNLALISRTNELLPPNKDGFIKVFVSFIKSNQEAYELFKTINFPEIDSDELRRIVNDIPLKINDSELLIKRVLERYQYIKSI